MNTSFERSANASDEWYTPREIIEALGEFDLDPCAPMHPLWPTAKIMYNKQDNGLIQNWGGRIWCLLHNLPQGRIFFRTVSIKLLKLSFVGYSDKKNLSEKFWSS